MQDFYEQEFEGNVTEHLQYDCPSCNDTGVIIGFNGKGVPCRKCRINEVHEMTTYNAQHADLFRAVAEILVRDYIAPSETAETVAEWCERWEAGYPMSIITLMEPSEIAALIADVEGYERREV